MDFLREEKIEEPLTNIVANAKSLYDTKVSAIRISISTNRSQAEYLAPNENAGVKHCWSSPWRMKDGRVASSGRFARFDRVLKVVIIFTRWSVSKSGELQRP